MLDHAALEATRFQIVAVRKDAAEDLWAEFEETTARTLGKEWKKAATRALRAGTGAWSGAHTKAAAGRVTAAATGPIGSWLDGDTFLESTIPMLYGALAEQFLREYPAVRKATATGKGQKFKINFSKPDRAAIDVISMISEQAAGSLFPDEVARKVQEAVEATVLNEGLPASEAAARLHAELEGALGLERTIQAVPSLFHTNPDAYFRVLANNASVLSTNIGRLIAMDDAAVEVYEVVAIRDAKTSAICAAMDGRLIPVRSGMAMVTRFLELGSAADVKEAFPWDSRRTARDIGADTAANNAALAESGLGFPPYHGHCRSTVIPHV